MKLAIIGKMGSGKSTLSQYLNDVYQFKVFSFGGAVKTHASEIFDLSTKDRSIIQNFAQKVKELDPDVWVKYLIKKMKDESGNIVVDDVRFPNEYDALYKEGFTFVKLDIDPLFQIERLKNAYPIEYPQHINRTNDISESFIDDMKCLYVYNVTSDSQGKIYNYIDRIINTLRISHLL